MPAVAIDYFTDILCVWAYIAQLRVDAVEREFGDQVRFNWKFCSVFGDARRKIRNAWHEKGMAGFNAHLRHSAEAFPEITLNPDLWLTVQPASSTGAHLFLKAAQLAEAAGEEPEGTAIQTIRALREAFFRDGRDIASWDVQAEVGAASGLDIARLEARIRDGSAFAELASDYQDADNLKLKGSPSFVLNQGRQTLYGNVGFRIIEANLRELLRQPNQDQASWC